MTGKAVSGSGTLPAMFFKQVCRLGDRTALLHRVEGRYEPISYGELGREVREVAAGLITLGVKPGDRVAVISYNRPEWVAADLGILSAGAITIPIYHAGSRSQADRILLRTGARFSFVSRSEKAEMLMTCDAPLDKIIALDPPQPKGEWACSLDYRALREMGAKGLEGRAGPELDRRITGRKPEDCATIIFTAGTTGEPMGVMLSHGNILANAAAGLEAQPVHPDDIYLSFLPLSHMFERTIGQYLMLMAGVPIAYAASVRKVTENMSQVRPTVMLAVPRFFEKVYSRIMEMVERGPPWKRFIFNRAFRTGHRRRRVLAAGGHPGPILGFLYRAAHRLVFQRIKDQFGGRMRFFVSGGAPLEAEITEFFLAAGLEILEGYGLTEASPVISVNRLGRVRPGTVGTPFSNLEVKIAGDGEIMVRGPSVMIGYYEDEEATARVIRDGWLCTGDLGVMEEGYLRISGRKKEIIVTAGGKNISPQKVENLILEDDLISQVMVYGDRQKYLSALVVPDYRSLEKKASELGLDGLTPEALAGRQEVHDLLMDRVAERTAGLARYESVKKIVVLPGPFTHEKGELTPDGKVRREAVYEHYRDRLEALYGDERDPALPRPGSF